MSYPRTAYILLWFPKASETFIFREAVNLKRMGLPLDVFSLYGPSKDDLSPEMRSAAEGVERLGVRFTPVAAANVLYWWRRNRRLARNVLGTLTLKRWSGFEKTGENFWAFLCGFYLSRRFEQLNIDHIHAPWASGPATAAWTASRLTGVPFSFTGRAWDIFTADRGLKDKLAAAAIVRAETRFNVDHMATTLGGDRRKIHLTYNGVPLTARRAAPAAMTPPYKLLALGRFVEKKGYEYLLRACRIMLNAGLNIRLALAGDGPLKARLTRLTRKLGIDKTVSFPGFVRYDQVSALFQSADVFLAPSVVAASGDRDGIPTVIMEALMHRVPVIAADVSGIPELIEDEETGLLIPQKDPAAIAAAVARTVGDRDAAIRMAEAGRARVLEMFDPERNHRKVLELYVEHFGARARGD